MHKIAQPRISHACGGDDDGDDVDVDVDENDDDDAVDENDDDVDFDVDFDVDENNDDDDYHEKKEWRRVIRTIPITILVMTIRAKGMLKANMNPKEGEFKHNG